MSAMATTPPRTYSVSFREVHRSLNDGRFQFLTFLSILFLAGIGNGFYDIVTSLLDVARNAPAEGGEPVVVHLGFRLAITALLGIGLAACYFGVRARLQTFRDESINLPASGLIVMAKYLPETVRSLEVAGPHCRAVTVILPPATARENQATASQEIREYVAGSSRLAGKTRFAELANLNQSWQSLLAVREAVYHMNADGVPTREIVIDVSEVPIHTFTDLAADLGDSVQAFQTVRKNLTRDGEEALAAGKPLRDIHFQATAPFRFRTVGVEVTRGPEGGVPVPPQKA